MKFLQFLYNLLFPLFFILLLPGYLPRMLRRGGYQETFLQRFGIFHREAIGTIGHGRLWVHAVSVGEVFIALKFIRYFHKCYPEARFILSVTTTTGLEVATRAKSPWLEPIASPLDFFFITNTLFNRFKPAALIMVEGDLWLQRLWYCKQHGIPVAIISARLSPRSEKRFQKLRTFIAPIFNLLDFIGFTSESDQERWKNIGITSPRYAVTGNIKFDQTTGASAVPPQDQQEIFSKLGWSAQDPVLLAGSTYDLGEEEEVIKAWLLLRAEFPALRLIIAPRHAERRHEVAALFEKQDVSVALRSLGVSHPSAALLLDTTGELQSWYCVASVIFIGKSLGMGAAHGGQNLVEPLALGRPVLVGPFMDNFEPLTSHLLEAKGIILVKNGEEIASATQHLLLHPEEATKMVERGSQLLQADQGATERTCCYIKKLLH